MVEIVTLMQQQARIVTRVLGFMVRGNFPISTKLFSSQITTKDVAGRQRKV
jgi:hypothetical protein